MSGCSWAWYDPRDSLEEVLYQYVARGFLEVSVLRARREQLALGGGFSGPKRDMKFTLRRVVTIYRFGSGDRVHSRDDECGRFRSDHVNVIDGGYCGNQRVLVSHHQVKSTVHV